MAELDIKKALSQLGGSIKLYKTLVEGFMDKYLKVDMEIKHALLSDSCDEARRLAHSMKGLAGNLGAMDLHIKAKNLESVIKKSIDVKDREEKVASILTVEWRMFSKELKAVSHELDKILSATDYEVETAYSSKELSLNQSSYRSRLNHGIDDNKQLEEIKGLVNSLNTYNYEVINTCFKEINHQYFEKTCHSSWIKVKEYIGDLEYDEAKRVLVKGVLNE